MILKKKTKKVVSVTPTETPVKERTIIPPLSITHDNNSMRGLFFVVKGQFRKGVEPSFVNQATNDVSYIGGYDPSRPETSEWYMLLDKVTFHCVACGSDFNKVLRGVYTIINRYKGDAKKYFKHISDTTSDDYYETHYLGKRPLSREEVVKKAEGRCPRVSPVMRSLYSAIYSSYGQYYSEEIEEMEDLAYHDLEEVLRESKPINKTKKRLAKTKIQKIEMETPKSVEVTPKKKMVKPKVKLGVKKLSLG